MVMQKEHIQPCKSFTKYLVSFLENPGHEVTEKEFYLLMRMFEEKYPKKELMVADSKNTIYYIYKEACGTIVAVFGIRN